MGVKKIDHITYALPIVGITAFLGLCFLATTLYPGGSQWDLNSEGFDWMHNYWCNLMNGHGMNGEVNPAQPIAIVAWIILCMSMMLFFIQFTHAFSQSRYWNIAIKWGGIFSMLFASLIFTAQHDLMTIIASVFGVFVVVGIIRTIYLSELTLYKVSGMICVLLLGMNNYVYYTGQFMEWLPLLQKITFAIVLLWVLGLNVVMIKKRRGRLTSADL